MLPVTKIAPCIYTFKAYNQASYSHQTNLMKAVFIELPFFEQYRKAHLTDEEYRALQNELLINPEKGDLIQGVGGLRKIRIADSKRNKGKRGGARVIYYWHNARSHIVFFTAYGKDVKDDLSQEERQILANLLTKIKATL